MAGRHLLDQANFLEGVQAAFDDREVADLALTGQLSDDRLRRPRFLENQQTGVAKKVYGAVPINEAWPSKSIVAELTRQGQVRDFSIIEGCLNTLKEVGLIKETAPGHFQRVKPKPTVEKEAEPMTTKTLNPPTKSEPAEPVDRLAAIGTRLRSLSKTFLELADDIDEATLAFEEKASGNDEELAKLRQLKGLLKSLS